MPYLYHRATTLAAFTAASGPGASLAVFDSSLGSIFQAVEHWNVEPGDGCVYFTIRPPWVAIDKTEVFFTLHPEERSFETVVRYREARTEQIAATERVNKNSKERNWRGIVIESAM